MHKKPDGRWDKTNLPSRHVTEGPTKAPQRSYFYAMGLGTREINQPFVGVASCWNEAAPCNTALLRQAHAVSVGVKEAGGTPREFCTITVTDGIAMGHEGMRSSLASREVIADSVELTMRGHAYDALVGLAGCDKSLPGMMMAMLRLNVPSVFMYGGSILPGRLDGKDITVQDVFEGVGQFSAGKITGGPAGVFLEYHPLRTGRIQPYAGAGVAFLIVFGTKDGALSGLTAKSSAGPAIGGGVDLMVNSKWGAFVDVKKAWLGTIARGSLGGIPIKADVRVDPMVYNVGVAYHF